MITSRMQLNALIRNKAAGDGDKAQILLRIYMMERLLERISVSGYRDNFILKGGMLVSSLVGVDMRTTMDIDTTVRALPLTQEKAREFLEEIMAIDLEDNVSFRITKVEDIMEGHEYEGVRFHIEGALEKLRQTIKIDISTGDAITPAAVEYELPLILEERKIGLWAYNMETLLAEKLETVMTRAEANTRMRDFYDIYILTRQDAMLDMLSSVILSAFADVIGDEDFEKVLSQRGKSYGYEYEHYATQYVDKCNVEYLKTAPEKRKDKIRNIAKRLIKKPDAYRNLLSGLESSARRHGCSIHELHDPDLEYPEEIEW